MSRTIDKFGRRRKYGSVVVRGPPGVGFKLTPDGQYDMQKKILKNTAEPVENNDCVTLSCLEDKIKETKEVTLLALQAAIQSTIGNVSREARQAFDDKIAEARITLARKYNNHKSDVEIKISDATATMTQKYEALEQRIVTLEKKHEEKKWPKDKPLLWYPGIDVNPN